MEKESLDLTQIKSVLGERKFAVPESVRDIIQQAEKADESNQKEKHEEKKEKEEKATEDTRDE